MDASSNARILITGGSGFLGTNLVELYRRADMPVRNLDPHAPRNPEHEGNWRRASVLDRAELWRQFDSFRPTHIFNLAARTDMRGVSVDDYAVNTEGIKNVLNAVEGRDEVQRLVLASSRLVCKIGYQPRHDEDYCPTTPYGASKVVAEQSLRTQPPLCAWTIVRPTSIWGPWFDRPYREFFDAVRRGRYVHPRGKRIPKSFGFVGNSVVQLAALMSQPISTSGETLNLADYEPIEVGTFANRIHAAFGKPGTVRRVPLGVLKAMAKSGDLLERAGLEAPITSFRLSNLMTPMIMNLDPLRTLLPTLPFTEAAGIAETVDWMQRKPARNRPPYGS